jgi:hypothetical protein
MPIETNSHKDLHHQIFVILPTLLAGVGIALALWNINHLAALIVLSSTVVAVSIYEMHVRDCSTALITTVCFIYYALALVAYRFVGPNPHVETDREVYLIPANKPTPHAACDGFPTKQSEGSIAILAGSNEFMSNVDGGVFNIITLDKKPVVTMKKSEGGLLFSVDLFDPSYKLVAKISDNKSILIPKNYSYNKRSEDLSELTLYDDQDKELLYVEYLNAHTLLIRGMFSGPDGTAISISDDQILQRFYPNAIVGNCYEDMNGHVRGENGSLWERSLTGRRSGVIFLSRNASTSRLV